MSKNISSLKQLAKDISEVENSGPAAEALLDKAWETGTFAYRVGITGPPGAGKSTLVNCLAAAFSDAEKKTAVISVDPSSPFSGGAILGDRIRMNALSGRKNVYIRSMASRGSLGGLSIKTHDVCDILDGYGFEIILIETVGVGQIELDIAKAADVTLTVLVPESGDDIQAMKSGIMEVSDIFIVNKSDRHGADAMLSHLRSLIALRKKTRDLPWRQIVIPTIAINGEGIDEVMKVLEEFHEMLEKQEAWQKIRRERMENKVFQIVNENLSARFWTPEKRELLRQQLEFPTRIRQSPANIAKKLLMDMRNT